MWGVPCGVDVKVTPKIRPEQLKCIKDVQDGEAEGRACLGRKLWGLLWAVLNP